jgi:hypothetical protein
VAVVVVVAVLVLAGDRRGWSWPAATDGRLARGDRRRVPQRRSRERRPVGASASESGANAGPWLKG